MNRCEDDCLWCGGSISEANANLPRKVRFDETTKKVLSAALLVFLIGVVGYTWISYDTLNTIHIRDVLHHEGRTSDGVVTSSSLNHSGIRVKYWFTVDGISYYGQAEMKESHYRAPMLGGMIHILYLPSNPNVSLPISWEWFSAWDMIPFVFVLFTTIASGAVIAGAFRERQLARMGVVVEGRVTGCAPDQKPITIYYEFTTEDNALIEGNDLAPAEREVGTSIPIIYLRRMSRFREFGQRDEWKGCSPASH